MVIDGEEHGSRLLGRVTQPHGGATAVRADFEERTAGHLGAGAHRNRMEDIALLGGHETVGGERDFAPGHH